MNRLKIISPEITRIEFNEIMDVVGVYNPLVRTIGKFVYEDVYIWHDMAIWFHGGYAIVHGRIPLEVANTIYQKYPGNPYHIRVDGDLNDRNPNDCAIDDKFEEERRKIVAQQDLSAAEFKTKIDKAFDELDGRNVDDKYITCYHIDTKEGLLIFLTEIKDYYLRKKNLPETEVARYDQLLAESMHEVLRRTNPGVSAYDWMQGDEENREKYNSACQIQKRVNPCSLFGAYVRAFDRAVNPFIDECVRFDEISNSFGKVYISVHSTDFARGEYREGCCRMKIVDLATNNFVEYEREPHGFLFKSVYFDNGARLSVTHFFDSQRHEEFIVVDSHDGKIKVLESMYSGESKNISVDGVSSDEVKDAHQFICDTLFKALGYTESITIQNMKSADKAKTLTLKG